MSRWFNVDVYGNYQGVPADQKKIVSGENPEHLARYALESINDCFMREIGRLPRRIELELIWSRTLNKKEPKRFPRDPESEVL